MYEQIIVSQWHNFYFYFSVWRLQHSNCCVKRLRFIAAAWERLKIVFRINTITSCCLIKLWCCWHAVLTLSFLCDLWFFFFYFISWDYKNKISFEVHAPFMCIYCFQIISYFHMLNISCNMKLHSSFFYDFEILFPSNWPSRMNIYQFGEVMTISCGWAKSLEDKKIFGWRKKWIWKRGGGDSQREWVRHIDGIIISYLFSRKII